MKDINELKRELFDAIESICKDYEKPAEPKFKVGQWAGWEQEDGTNYLFRITNISENKVYGDCDEKEYYGDFQCYLNDLVSVTPSEIEAHLRKICDEKYIGKKVIDLCDNEVYLISSEPHDYNDDNVFADEFWMVSDDRRGVQVYKQGKFADIIPDKKKLPKTREEFAEFCKHWLDDDQGGFVFTPENRNEWSIGINKFLNEYE